MISFSFLLISAVREKRTGKREPWGIAGVLLGLIGLVDDGIGAGLAFAWVLM